MSPLNEVCCGDESGAALDLVPLHHLLVGDVPQPQLTVQRGRQEELMVKIQARNIFNIQPFSFEVRSGGEGVSDHP